MDATVKYIYSRLIRDSDGTEEFGEAPNNSMYTHSFVQLGKYNGSPFVTGSFQTNNVTNNNNKTEIFDMNTNSWEYESSNDYPYGTL